MVTDLNSWELYFLHLMNTELQAVLPAQNTGSKDAIMILFVSLMNPTED